MKKTATVTFHASHNYGSMLQAYALQQTLLSLGVGNEIINLRSARQKKVYPHPNDTSDLTLKQKSWRLLQGLIYPKAHQQLIKKFNLFEDFLKEDLILTEELPGIEKGSTITSGYDYYITGSDQCWNTCCSDFDWAYFLTFTESKNKISYASSIGPFSHFQCGDRIAEELRKFRAISAREQGTAEVVERLTGVKPTILPDPTLLITREHWLEFGGREPILKRPYIFLYTPYAKPDINEIAILLSKKMNLPLVVSNFTGVKDDLLQLRLNGAQFKLDIGPKEFINLVANANAVVSGSFHALVFSIILHVPFWAVNGDTDNRMSQLLDKYGLKQRAIHLTDIADKLSAPIPDFQFSDKEIQTERERALQFLQSNLDLDSNNN